MGGSGEAEFCIGRSALETIATLFSGGEGVGGGAEAAGLHHMWGIEINDDIAQVARSNGFHVVTADVTAIDPGVLDTPDILHASPPCPNFSQAKTGAEESENDVRMARATARFVETLMPRVFTLENVWGYRKSESWRLIVSALNRLGYWTTVHHLNSADFGVPQTRKRMIVHAVRDGWVPPLPLPEPWQGWYQAIEDLLPGLPDSEFAPWQLKRGVEELLNQSCLLAQGSFDHADVGNERAAQPIGKRAANEPAFTVTASSSMRGVRAFLVSATNSNGLTIRDADEPANTVVSTSGEKGTCPRAFRPGFTVGNVAKAFPHARLEQGRVVRLTLRALARLQMFPDWYKLPDKKIGVAGYVIGNAVPPLLYRKIVDGFQ